MHQLGLIEPGLNISQRQTFMVPTGYIMLPDWNHRLVDAWGFDMNGKQRSVSSI